MSKLPPPDYLRPIAAAVELTVLELFEDQPHLRDKDVEFVYDSYRKYFRAARTDPDAMEPSSTSPLRMQLLDRIWEQILLREEEGMDDHLVHGYALPGGRPIKCLEDAYEWIFKRLLESARFWRKDGPGYLTFLVGSLKVP